MGWALTESPRKHDRLSGPSRGARAVSWLAAVMGSSLSVTVAVASEPAAEDRGAQPPSTRAPARQQPPSAEPADLPAPEGNTARLELSALDELDELNELNEDEGEAVESDEDVDEVVVVQSRRTRPFFRASGDFRVTGDVLAAAPRSEGAEVLRAAPGLYIGRGEGPAVAHSYMLRGFDAEHGQDIEFHVAGLPINLPSHLHGQGYADLSFLIAEAVGQLQVREGVYDPRQGDFAVAGSIDVALAVPEEQRGVQLRAGTGAFDTQRVMALWAPKGESEETLGAVQLLSTDGFGQNRAGQSSSVLLQHRFGSGALSYRAVGIAHSARANSAGVVRRDDVQSGRTCFYCVYPLATARAQNALSQRVLIGLFADLSGRLGESGELGIWLGQDNFRIQSNFTGFTERSGSLANVAGRGDLIEQINETRSFGLSGRYRAPQFHLTPWAHVHLEVGGSARVDAIEQRQNLLDASVRSQTWDQRVDAAVRGVDIGGFAEGELRLGEAFLARLGLRANSLSYAVEDRLSNFAPLSRPQDAFIVGFRRSAQGVRWGPRSSLEYRANWWLSLLAAYGHGYRSPVARSLEDGEPAPFTRVRSADVGVRASLGDPFSASLTGYFTQLSDDLAFDAGEGRLERIGPTRRVGLTLYTVLRPTQWFVAAVSTTWVHATLLEPPPPTAEEPDPPFEAGRSLPFVPPLVVRADLSAQRAVSGPLAFGWPLRLRAGLGASVLSRRPLPYGDAAAAFGLVDAALAANLGPLELELSLFNALDERYAAVEYSFSSDWNSGSGVRPRTPARHTAAGSPRSWMLTLGAQL